jgi:hypothetical protein
MREITSRLSRSYQEKTVRYSQYNNLKNRLCLRGLACLGRRIVWRPSIAQMLNFALASETVCGFPLNNVCAFLFPCAIVL